MACHVSERSLVGSVTGKQKEQEGASTFKAMRATWGTVGSEPRKVVPVTRQYLKCRGQGLGRSKTTWCGEAQPTSKNDEAVLLIFISPVVPGCHKGTKPLL